MASYSQPLNNRLDLLRTPSPVIQRPSSPYSDWPSFTPDSSTGRSGSYREECSGILTEWDTLGPNHPQPRQRYTKQFLGNDEDIIVSRRRYLKSYGGGLILVFLTIFTVFTVFWGSLWMIPVKPLEGLVVDLDGGLVGLNVTLAVLGMSTSYTRWSYTSAVDFPGGTQEVSQAIQDERAWVAIVVNPGASQRLNTALLNPDSSYNGTQAITAYISEARQETAFRNFLRPQTTLVLDSVTSKFAVALARQMSAASNLASIMSSSPQTVTQPIYFSIDNLRPFHQPVATAATFVGLIYMLILSFFVVMVGNSARSSSGLKKQLTLPSLIKLRFASSFTAYLIVSLFYTALNKAFRLNMSETFGSRGFIILWMLNWIGMLSVGLALESMITILTPRYIPFFLILWIVANNSVCMNPIEMLPSFYRYGYGVPFYNISRATRTLSMGTHNEIGLNIAVLFVWIIISCFTLVVFQWYVRKREIRRQVHGNSKSLGDREKRVAGSGAPPTT
ncbi:hypothetical protein FA15DRAFT_598573 [Coprinopsis marcescibilis]|uniref:DUF3533 domain-containing protein n=1 Tax=Coprinopsis marcescibilis TaxID=230819 RepID=A0A5C3KL22_COPMA|nr:hypothetical protein FA15DRAFT_598573 [Coprinopsis marcescibilis]